MQTGIDRRTGDAPRAPLSALVELSHDDFGEPFEADGVNVSTRGIAMRATYLPEVGSKLVCRFDVSEGDRVEADAEVVWAVDAGERSGEFGARFLALASEAEAAIRKHVRSSEVSSTDPGEPAELPAKLHIDGIPTPVVARVTHRADDLIAVEQELPFLTIGRGVLLEDVALDAMRRGQIAAVSLDVDMDVPRLTIAILYDEPQLSAADDAPPAATSTVQDLPAPVSISTAEPPPEPPVMVAALPAERARSSERELDVPQIVRYDARSERAPSPAPAVSHEPRPVAAQPDLGPDEESDDELPSGLTRSQHFARGAELARSFAAWAGPRARALAARIGPLLAAALAAAGTHIGRALRAAAPTVRVIVLGARTFGQKHGAALVTWTRARFPRLAASARPRRTTAPAPHVAPTTRTMRKQGGAEELALPRNVRRRTIVMSCVAVAAIGLAVYALLPSDEDAVVPAAAAPAHASAPSTGPSSKPAPSATPAALPATAPPTAAPLLAPVGSPGAALPLSSSAATPVSLVAPPTPSALPEPSYAAGPMPAPSYPALPATARPAAPPRTLAQGSPYAVDVRGEAVAGRDPTIRAITVSAPERTMSFGAPSVPGGRSYLLRTSARITGVHGVPARDGFTVRIDGALSLDRAGPISATHPAVARAVVLNRGDHAELLVRFKDGMAPAYRVVARGSAVEIVIARR